MSSDQNVIVKPKGEVVPQDVLLKAYTMYPAAFGFATTDAGDILQGKENIDPTVPIEGQIKFLMEAQAQYKDQYMVMWFSKEPVSGESLQPFSVHSDPEHSPEGEIEVDKIVAFLVGDFKEKLKKDDPHTGAFWAHVEDCRPKLKEFIDACSDHEGFTYEDFQQMFNAKSMEVANKVFINEDNTLILLSGDGECEIYGEKEAGEGHKEQSYWIHTLLEEPKVVVEDKPGPVKLSKVKAKSTTASVPTVPLATPTKVEGQKLITPTGTVETVKASPPAWACGSDTQKKNWYALVNVLKDAKGTGVVPGNHAKNTPVDIDKRIHALNPKNMKDLVTAVNGLRAHDSNKAFKENSTHTPEITKVDRSISTRIVSADEKQKLKQDWLPMAKSGRYPAEIQADEKDAPTFKDITGVTMEDIKKMPFSAFVELAKYPTAAATLIHDLLHRPYGPIHGTVGSSDISKPTAPVSNPNAGKVKIKNTKAA